ncbi:acyl-CoA thioester hydrolase/BAAT C-terminal domain-containing protein [Bifidobacterium sp. ESL0745]|uniref:alpha/beta hydrolase family protein n=1 Tax=Bifidobacterium sp. ESL0745 TaxID=2983226 RepID=UPI0023F99B88|nr:acyl-CoA thioester hydrolase/BAAT C-terminal domain-containing protein [Bifidobacterium sp. ESL0745]MDF7665411.1 acyl-CoA thioester hydrolase/BAAT C-terminal domain-containing protein [Bifidobacterium sp. ESL0745]
MRLLKRFLPSVAVFVVLVAVLATLGTAMTPSWSIEPLTQHIKVTSADSTIKARSAKTDQEGTYKVNTRNLRIQLAPNVTINAILRSPVGAPGKRPATLFIHGAGTGKASEVYGDIASAMSSAGIVTLVPDKRLDTYTTFHRDYYAMAEDYMTSLNVLRSQPDVDPAQAGIYAESEGTWIAEAMAHRHPNAIPFMMLTSPPAVSGRRQMAMAANTYVDYIGAPKGLNRDVDKFIGLDFAPLGLQYADFPAEQYLKDLTMPILVSFGTDDLSMPIEQGATDIINGASAAGNKNVLVRYYHANHQMRVGAHTSVPGLPLDKHYTHDIEDWTNAVAAGTKADEWITPQIAGDQPKQRLAVPTSVKPGLIGSLSAILVLLSAIVLCAAMAGIVGLSIAIGHWVKRSGQTERGSSLSPDKDGIKKASAANSTIGKIDPDTSDLEYSWATGSAVRESGSSTAYGRFPHRLSAALALNGCCAVLGIAAFFAYVVIAAKSALTLTSRGTLLGWGWVLMHVIALLNVALLTWLVMELWRSRGNRLSQDNQSQGFWTPAHFIVAALCVISAVASLVMMAFFGLYTL